MVKKTETSDTAQVISLVSVTGTSLPQINPEHAAFLKANLPDDFFEEVGNREYELMRIKLDSKSFETVAVYEVAIEDEEEYEHTVYTCECRIRDGQLVRHDRKPVTMSTDRYEATRKR